MPYELPETVDRVYGQERPRYYVMRIGGGPARKAYGSRFRAEEDAVKLAQLHPGAEFAVVKVKSIFKSNAILLGEHSEQVPDGIRDEAEPVDTSPVRVGNFEIISAERPD